MTATAWVPELNFGLYRDNGLATHGKIPGRRQEKIRQELHQIFAKHNLRITIETNTTTANFLDVTLNLNNGTYIPYKKPNDRPLYVHVESNHPPSVIRQIPKSINHRLRRISSTKEAFDNAKKRVSRCITRQWTWPYLTLWTTKTYGRRKHRVRSNTTWDLAIMQPD